MGRETRAAPHRVATPEPTAQCANCKMPLEREPVEKGGRTFCCDGCADGGPCLC